MITVRQVFETAYGEIPDGATCHIGSQDCAGIYIGAIHYVPFYKRMMEADKGKWVVSCTEGLYGPDISDEPADTKLFRSIFGKEYEDALDALIAESKHPLNDVKFSDATPEQFKEFWSAKGFKMSPYDGLAYAWKDSADGFNRDFVREDGGVSIADRANGLFTTFGEAAEAIAAIETALGRFGE